MLIYVCWIKRKKILIQIFLIISYYPILASTAVKSRQHLLDIKLYNLLQNSKSPGITWRNNIKFLELN